VLLTDSLAVLQTLTSGNLEDNTLQNLIQKINNLTSRTTAVLQWIRANNDIHENKVADQLPKEGSMKQKSLSETRG